MHEVNRILVALRKRLDGDDFLRPCFMSSSEPGCGPFAMSERSMPPSPLSQGMHSG